MHCVWKTKGPKRCIHWQTGTHVASFSDIQGSGMASTYIDIVTNSKAAHPRPIKSPKSLAQANDVRFRTGTVRFFLRLQLQLACLAGVGVRTLRRPRDTMRGAGEDRSATSGEIEVPRDTPGHEESSRFDAQQRQRSAPRSTNKERLFCPQKSHPRRGRSCLLRAGLTP